MTTDKEIQGTTEDNNKILSDIMADRIKSARYNKSLKKMLNELNIEGVY